MARLPYPDAGAAELEGLIERIVGERGELLHLYHQLLHSPPVAAGWLALLTGIRQHTSVPGTVRELVIVRIGLLNDAPYEVAQHAPVARQEGVTQAQLDALPEWPASPLFSATERAALALADAMTRTVQVPEDVFAAARAAFDDRALVELVATIAAYNMVSRFLEALQVRSTDARPGLTRPAPPG
jgi:alkylhydroperoxidase family enzyme